MEEKEIIKWSGNFEELARIILAILVIITIIFLIIGFSCKSKYNYYYSTNYEKKINELEDVKKKSSSKQSEKYKELENIINNYTRANKVVARIGNVEIKENPYNKYIKYYINDEEVEYSTYSNKLKQVKEEAKSTEEYKKKEKEIEDSKLEYDESDTKVKQLENEKNKYIKSYENMSNGLPTNLFTFIGFLFLVITMFFIIIYFYLSKMEITVTNKRVYGKKAFGQRIDLPFDVISVVGTLFLKGIVVGTASGKIRFLGIKNNKEIHKEISKLLNERQEKKHDISAKEEKQKKNNIGTAEELKKYKDLLDSGAITQEEFDTKKKQLLNL